MQNISIVIRNVFIREGRVLIVISYNKSCSTNNYVFYVVRYLENSLGNVLYLMLTYIWLFIDFLANQLDLLLYYSSKFLFLDLNLKIYYILSSQAIATLQALTKDLPIPQIISLYQQASITIIKRYISKLIKKKNFYFPSNTSTPIAIIATGVGYYLHTLLLLYTIDKALLPCLQPELLEMSRRLSTFW